MKPWLVGALALHSLTAAASSANFTLDALPYNGVQQKSAHNAYQRPMPILTMLGDQSIRSLEYDLHVTKLGQTAPRGDWFVYHEAFDTRSQVPTLSAGLALVAHYLDA